MIEFIEKEPWNDPDPFVGETRVPVYMVKDGVEYFVINRVASEKGDSAYARQANDRLNTAKAMLTANDGRYCKFYGFYDDPAAMLKEMRERGHSFTEPGNLFDECAGERYGAGFTDFHGNRNEVSAAFHYRIFDKAFAAKLKEQAIPLAESEGTK